MAFPALLFARSRATLIVLVAILVSGVVTFNEIPKEAEPDTDVPVLQVTLKQTGIQPEDADRLLVRPVAQQLRTVEGVKELRSVAFAGGATITLEFETPLILGTPFDARRALELVRERLDFAEADLPSAAKRPKLEQLNPSLLPLMLVTVSGTAPQVEQWRHARALRDKLRALPAIANADITADRDEIVEVIIDPLMLSSYELDAETLLKAVNRANRPGESGDVNASHGHLNLAVKGLFDNTSDILDLPVKATSTSVVRLRDVATVRTTLTDRTVISRLNGQPATVIAVRKRVGANVMETVTELHKTVDALARIWPEGIQATYSQDRSWRIRARISELRNALVTAVVVVMSIILATLGFRSGLLVGLAIPGSLLIAVLALASLGVSINTAVLFAFVMSVGLLVDGAIVVVENADRLIAKSRTPRDAYLQSAREMAAPVICSCSTTLAAFLPLLVWPGAIGEYMRFFPLTMLLTLSASAVMALLFIPVLGAAMRPRTASRTSAARRSWLGCEYTSLLSLVLRRPGFTVGIAMVALVWSAWMYANYGRDIEFLPTIEPSGALVLVRATSDLSLEHKLDIALEVETMVLRYPAFESVFARIGSSGGVLQGSAGTGVIAEFLLEFRDWKKRAHGDRLLADLERRLAHVAGVSIEVRAQRDGPLGDKPIRIDITAPSQRDLDSAVAHARNNLASIRGLQGIEDSRTVSALEWQLRIDRAQAAQFDVDVAKIEQYVRFVTRGVALGTLEPQLQHDESESGRGVSERADIIMRFPSRYRSIEGLQAIRVQTSRGAVPLDHFASLTPIPRGGSVERVEGQLMRSIKADVEPGVLESDVVRDIRAQLPASMLSMNAGVRIRGQDEDRDEAREFLLHAFVAALLLMALILVVQFNSFYSAFVILLAVVLSSVGVRLGLLLTDMPYGIVMSGIGVVALVGIVVNNNVIFIDTYTRLRKRGHDAHSALLRTGEVRLRPILLTTVTTIAGLMPMVLGVDIDFVERTVAFGAPAAQYWAQMSSAVVFGLSFATVFTLLVTPAALMIRDNIRRARTRANSKDGDESIRRAFAQHGAVVGLAASTAIVAAWVFVPQITVIRLVDIFGKQIFEQAPSSWFQALESSGFYCLIMLAAAYAYWRNDHVRVDIIRERLSARGKAMIEIFGFVTLLAPVCVVVLVPGFEIVMDSILKEEISGALFGTASLWIFKAMMLLCFAQLLAIGAYVTWKNVRFLRGREAAPYPPQGPGRAVREGDERR